MMRDHVLGEPATELVFFVNGRKVVEPSPNPEWTLLHYLRNKLKLCGTKLGCAEGGCGACTVMVSKYNRKENRLVHLSVNACLAPVCAMHGLAVTTVEGIGSTRTKLHPVQERIANSHGSQCGFCTPGIVMSMYTLLRSSTKKIDYEDMEVAFQGNLCRCTGYRPIIEGYKTFLEEWEQIYINGQNGSNSNGNANTKCGLGENCCKNKKTSLEEQEEIFQKSSFKPYDPSQEPIFPPELRTSDVLDKQSLLFKGPLVTWYRPTTLQEILNLKEKNPEAKIVVGNSEIGVEVKFKHAIYPVIIAPTSVPELNTITETEEGLVIGASVTLSDMETELRRQIKNRNKYETRIFQEIVSMLNWFAGKQIRNVAAVGGNIMTGSPISDLNPIFMAAKITLNVESKINDRRSIKMDENFFVGYRRNVIQPNELLCSILIPFSEEYQYFKAYKQAKRRDDDIAIVNAAINVTFYSKTNIIKDIRMAFGGMAPTTVLSVETCEKVKNQKWNEALLEQIFDNLLRELPLSPSAPGGMIQYRRSLTLSLFFKAYLAINTELSESLLNSHSIPSTQLSGIYGFHTQIPKSSQYFEIVDDGQLQDSVNKTIPHRSAIKQATGEAVYNDDIPSMDGELYLAFVLSNKAHAKVISVDAADALSQPGVVAFFSAADLDPHKNAIGPVVHDEELFITTTVTSQGQTIGVVVAEDQITAQRAARKVKIVYEEISPIIVTIEDAIKHKSFIHSASKTIRKGNVDNEFMNAENIVEGECRMGGQEHFYFETHAAYAIPKKEDNEIEIFSSTQHPSEVAKMAAHVLGIPINRIAVRVKRLGGGFGGKESRGLLIALPVALAAHKLNRPVRCMLDRDEDMQMTGTRHPFYIKYKVAFTNEGKITAVRAHVYSNAGYSLDLSGSVSERALFHIENAYYVPNMEVTGYVCKTNLPSNTAFRGFGGPQGMFAAEHFIRDVAAKLNRSIEEVQKLNLYKEGDLTHYNQSLAGCNLDKCWSECVAKSRYFERKETIVEFNRQNRWKKKGISIVPTKFGIAFTALFLNQAGALVIVYIDGSVLLTHGGIEMGQGLHTKMIQVASKALGLDISKIHITETATDKVPNTSATAASAGSDLNGMAVLDACNTINERLKPFKERNPEGKWEDWVTAAYFERVSLSATGFYATPGIGYDFDTNSGDPFNYFTYGVACSEVEIDCLTGDHQVLRSDIVMDLGTSINPAIDIGQIEGAFMQGYGLFTIEELIYSPTGTLYSRGPGAYKIPGFADIPIEFNVSLLKGVSNPRAVFSSKAVGEPPLFLASSVYFAIKEAIRDARRDAGCSEEFKLESPATSARIRMACEDHITAKVEVPKAGSYTPWNVVP